MGASSIARVWTRRMDGLYATCRVWSSASPRPSTSHCPRSCSTSLRSAVISLSARRTLFAPESEIAGIGGISIPDWSDVTGVGLLSAVDYYEDAAFNALQLTDLLVDIRAWRDFENHREDPEQRSPMIEQIENVLGRLRVQIPRGLIGQE